MKKEIMLTVNDWEFRVETAADKTLLDVLRDDLGLTGTKNGCETGECGSCTILLDGIPVLSCLKLAYEAEGKHVQTIEGLATGGELTPLQKAFVDYGAIQCGFCTPGMVLSATALLQRNPKPTIEEIKKGISGNLCRCTGYIKIIEAIGQAAQAHV